MSKVITIKSTPAAKAPAKETAVATSAKAKAAELAAAKLAAESVPVTELVEAFHLAQAGDTASTDNAAKLLSMLELAKIEASNYRVTKARLAYRIATHPMVATRRSPVNVLGAARVIVGRPGIDETEVDKLARSYRSTLGFSVTAGEALAAKGFVYMDGTPTEAERAIVERSLDATVRAKATKGNAKTKAAAAKGKGTDSKDAGSADLPDGLTPADILKAAKAVLTMATGYTSTGGQFTRGQADALADVMAELEATLSDAVAE